MVDLSNLISQDASDENARLAATTPTPTATAPSIGESYSAAWDEAKYYGSLGARYNSQADFLQSHLDAFKERTGETIPNPMKIGFGMPTADQQIDAFDYARQRFAAQATPGADSRVPDRNALRFPTDQEIADGGVALSRKALMTGADVSDRSSGPMALLGKLGGSMASGATDPLNAIAMAAIPEGGLILKTLASAGAFAGQAAVEDALTASYKNMANPAGFGVSDVIGDVIGGALGGAGFELAGAGASKLVGLGWRRLVNKNPAAAAALPLAARDAGAVAERASDLDAQNPFATGSSGEAAHNEAIVTVEHQILAGEAPALPDSAAAEAAKRTGEVFVPPNDDGVVPRAEWDSRVNARARAIDPETFSQADSLDSKISDARQRLADNDVIRQNMLDEDPLKWLKSADQQRVLDLQDQLGALTGKRRGGAPAKAMQAELDGLKQNALDAQDEALNRYDAGELDLRQGLVDAQNDRAHLGPKVNAARAQAEGEANAMGLRAERPAPAPASHSGATFQAPQPGQPLKTATAMPDRAIGRAHVKKGPPPAPAIEPPSPAAPDLLNQPPQPAPPAPAAPPPGGGTQAFYSGSRSIRIKYELAEAGDLITSHDDGFHENPAYPQNWQPRNRGGKPATAQVLEILNKLEPELLGRSVDANSGAPIVGPDNIVESGNGRAMALRMAHERGSADGYRAFLEREGFDTSGFKEPVLIRRRVTAMSDAQREDFAHAANGSASLRMSPTEQALADARHIAPEIAALARPGEITNMANRDFVRAFVAKLPPGEQGALLAQDGSLSAAGVDRMRAAMFARAYGDPGVINRLYEDADPNIKVIGRALSNAAPDWMLMRDAVSAGKLAAGQDVTDNVMEAVKSIMLARDTGRPVSEVLAQGNMFTADVSGLVARLFMKEGDTAKFLSKEAMSRNVGDFARGLRADIEGGKNLMGEAPRSAEQVLKDTASASDRRVAALVEAAKSSKAIEAAMSDPKMDDSLFAGLTRDIEQGNNKFVTEDGKTGVADVALAKIESDEALANEINACSLPPAAEAAE